MRLAFPMEVWNIYPRYGSSAETRFVKWSDKTPSLSNTSRKYYLRYTKQEAECTSEDAKSAIWQW